MDGDAEIRARIMTHWVASEQGDTATEHAIRRGQWPNPHPTMLPPLGLSGSTPNGFTAQCPCASIGAWIV